MWPKRACSSSNERLWISSVVGPGGGIPPEKALFFRSILGLPNLADDHHARRNTGADLGQPVRIQMKGLSRIDYRKQVPGEYFHFTDFIQASHYFESFTHRPHSSLIALWI